MNAQETLEEIQEWLEEWENTSLFTDEEILQKITYVLLDDPDGNFPDRENLIPHHETKDIDNHMELEELIDDIKSDIQGDSERSFHTFQRSDYKRRMKSITCALSRIAEETDHKKLRYTNLLRIAIEHGIE